MRRNALSFTFVLLALTGTVSGRANDSPADSRGASSARGSELLDAVGRTVAQRFYDPDRLDHWSSLVRDGRQAVRDADTFAGQAAAINRLLAGLNASHTELLTPDEPRYYHLLSVFHPEKPPEKLAHLFPGGHVSYAGIGAFYLHRDGEMFIKAVWPGFPAAEAGLHAGDRIVRADGAAFQPIRSFAGMVGRPVRLIIQSTPEADARREVVVRPVQIEPREAFLRAQAESFRLIPHNGKQVAYVHVWSYAGLEYQMLLRELLSQEAQDSDALVLDLRDGLGGADPEYLALFDRRLPETVMRSRNGEVVRRDNVWRKPVALLVNEGTTSGKEIFAYGFQQCGFGPVIGARTAGAVLGGSAFLMPEDCLLYLAVADVQVDGRRLEGVGVAPDVEVPWDVPYAAGRDPQLQKALDVVCEAEPARASSRQ